MNKKNHMRRLMWVGRFPGSLKLDESDGVGLDLPGLIECRDNIERMFESLADARWTAVVIDEKTLPGEDALSVLRRIEIALPEALLLLLAEAATPVSSIADYVNGLRNFRLVTGSADDASALAQVRRVLDDALPAETSQTPPETAQPVMADLELARLTRQATIDDLTSLLRREEMFSRCEEDFVRSRRMRQPVCCVMCDIDHFKRVNDVFGHAMGDRTLQQVARLLSEGRRRYDRVGRIGGEEFMLLFYGVNFDDGLLLAERLRKSIENFAWEEASLPPVTMSFGVAECLRGDYQSLNDLVKAADDALYEAKRNGRNQVRGWRFNDDAEPDGSFDDSQSMNDDRQVILVVDDTSRYLEKLKTLLEGTYRVDATSDPRIALKWAENRNYDLVLTDENMPEIFGHQLLARLKVMQPACVRFIMTAHGELNTAIQAINQGEVHYFVIKPWKDEELLMAVHQALEQQSMVRKLRDSDRETVMALVDTLELKERSTRGHYHRVAELSLKLARQLGYPRKRCESMEYAAWLHDVGKVGIPDHILLKHEVLTAEEEKMICRHPQMGANLVASVDKIASIAPIIRHHHERYDGKGYPDGLKGESIPEEARIIAIANSYDGLLSARRGRPALTPEAALEEIRARSGSFFDPDLVDVFEHIVLASPRQEPEAQLLDA